MKKRRSLAVLLACALLLSLAACGSQTAQTPTQPGRDYAIREASYPQMAPYPNEEDYIGPNGSFDDEGYDKAFDAWWKDVQTQSEQPEGYADSLDSFFPACIRTFLSDAQGENKVCSPLNLYMALAMLAELTSGTSRQQVLDLLDCDGLDALRTQAAALWNANYCKDGLATSILASSLWLNQDVNFIQSTMDTLADTYHASSFQGSMGDEAFSKALQDWINQQTGGLLEEQASGLELDPNTVLALATTVYFQGRWGDEFSSAATEEGIFYGEQKGIPCDFMHQSGVRNFHTGTHFSAAAQDIDNSGSMWLILPEEGSSPDALLQDEELYAFLSNVYHRAQYEPMMVNLSLPKFDVTSNMELKDGLRTLGVTDVFDPDLADFSPTTDDGSLVLSQAEHAARVVIDEEGCTAAAYTVMMLTGSEGPMETEEINFILDRPFLFVLTGRDGLPLFAGVVNQPV